MTPPPDPVAALAEAFLNGIGDEWEEMYPFVSMTTDTASSILAALTAAGWTLARRSEREALVGLWEAANRYRQDVAQANEYLNQDLPSAKALVFGLGKARAAIEGGRG